MADLNNLLSPFFLNDKEIRSLDFRRWESKNISINAPKDQNNINGKIEWELKPTYLGVALRIQDLMVLKIITKIY